MCIQQPQPTKSDVDSNCCWNPTGKGYKYSEKGIVTVNQRKVQDQSYHSNKKINMEILEGPGDLRRYDVKQIAVKIYWKN